MREFKDDFFCHHKFCVKMIQSTFMAYVSKMTSAFAESLLSLDQHLIQLIYRSRSLIEGAEYNQLLQTCLRNNPKRDITGVLISHSGWFLQVLEGTAENVFSLFKLIETDPRHADFLLLRFNAIESRDFTDWSMASISVDEQRFINLATQALHAEDDVMKAVRDFLCYGKWTN
jgi:Sensors of blue-light using FAD